VSIVVRIPVGVVVERRKADSPWIDFLWRPTAVLPGEPAASAWTMLSEDSGGATFYAGRADLELHHGDASSYRENLSTGEPKLWIILRATGEDPPFSVVRVTADGSEGEAFTAAGDDIVDHVPMPEPIRNTVAAFVAEHHVEESFFKRKRDRADPEALGRRRVGKEDEE
jgi:hypothetical protein